MRPDAISVYIQIVCLSTKGSDWHCALSITKGTRSGAFCGGEGGIRTHVRLRAN